MAAPTGVSTVRLASPPTVTPFAVRQSSWKMVFGRAEPAPSTLDGSPRRWFEPGFDDVRWPGRGLRPGLLYFQPPLLAATPPASPADPEPGERPEPGAEAAAPAAPGAATGTAAGRASGSGSSASSAATQGSQRSPASEELPAQAYFRKRFVLLDRRAIQALVLDVRRGDGITVYLNGKTIARDDRPLRPTFTGSSRGTGDARPGSGPPTAGSGASAAQAGAPPAAGVPASPPARTAASPPAHGASATETATSSGGASAGRPSSRQPSASARIATTLGPWPAHSFSVCVPTDLLLDGENLLAVEVKQRTPGSGDLSFDLDLTGRDRASLVRGPYLQVGTPTSGVVRWRTDCPTSSVVRLAGPDGKSRLVEDAAPVTEHEVPVGGLTPDTRYGYALGFRGAGDLTWLTGGDPETAFVTAPSQPKPTRVWILGDSGTKDDRPSAVRDAFAAFSRDRPADLWLMLGDNAYDRGTDAEFQEAVFDVFARPLRQMFLWSAVGNHETAQAHDLPRVAASPYFQIFTMPTRGEAGGVPSGNERYYSFDYGDVHFVCLDSMTTSAEPNRLARTFPGAMLDWLKADLAARTQRFTIAFFHHPPYTKGTHDSDSSVDYESFLLRQTVLPLLEQNGVDLVLSGHSHVYERSFPLLGHHGVSRTFAAEMKKDGGTGRPSESGPYVRPADAHSAAGTIYVVAGSSGSTDSRRAKLNHPAMFIGLARIGSLVLDVDGPRLDARFLRDTGFTEDHFTIWKGPLDNRLPQVSLEGASGDTAPLGSPVRLTARATDDGSVARVDFFRNPHELIGSDTEAPFELAFTPATPGAHQIIAEAVDDKGARAMSLPVVVTVTRP
jgi:hypothetical protein